MYSNLFNTLLKAGFGDWVGDLLHKNEIWFTDEHHGDFKKWSQAIDLLPEISSINVEFSTPSVSITGTCTNPEKIRQSLSLLKPWRKGPFKVHDVFIDTEWHSDYKWERVLPHLAPLIGRKILDVGCGNGYHIWRMLDQSPKSVLGIDPSVLFNIQFQVIQHYIADDRAHMLPITLEDVPMNMQWFDTVFSMGVLYHRRSPFDHLLHLKSLLKKEGELCLETLVIEGGAGQVLVPELRYARMNNVWFLPSCDELVHWLKRCGFINVRVVDVNQTGIDEQRTTEWMPFESLADCLDENDVNKTVEGYPAPLRAIILANKP